MCLKFLKDLSAKMDERSKDILLIFDAIHIRKELSYNDHHDRVEGFADLGDSR